MIRLIIMDLDGTLVDAREIHFLALNRALEEIDPKFVISLDDHYKLYDGLPTKKKLEKLSQIKSLKREDHNSINSLKQKYTVEVLKEKVGPDLRLQGILSELKKRGIKLYVASNSIYESIKVMLLQTGLMQYIDYIFSNEDVKNSKPHSEMYLRAMAHAGVNPDETLIIEDSPHGRESAHASGAHVCGVDNPLDFSLEKILTEINRAKSVPKVWKDSKLNVVIPLAGDDSNKYLTNLKGKFMIHRVIESLGVDAQFTYILKEENSVLETLLNTITPGCNVVRLQKPTQGAAESVLAAKHLIDNNQHLIIAFGDQIVDYDASDFIFNILSRNEDGGILTFEDMTESNRWSFVNVSERSVVHVAEKLKISNLATCGVYFWNKGSDFVESCEEMIRKDLKINGLYYVAPVFNQAIEKGKKISWYSAKRMISLGNDAYIKAYLDNSQ